MIQKDKATIIRAPDNIGPLRADLFFKKHLFNISRSEIARYIKTGAIRRSDKGVLKASSMVIGGEEFIYKPPQTKDIGIRPQHIGLNILYSDDYLAIIEKPKGMVVHPGAGVYENTLCNALLYHFPNMEIGDAKRPGIVHRLDKDTSGVMVVAKTHHVQQALSVLFNKRAIEKKYRLICFNNFDERAFDLITGHTRHPHNRLKFLTSIPAPITKIKSVRRASTSFKVLKQNGYVSYLEAHLHTGRTHQIRAQLADLGHPILGDELYGGQRTIKKSIKKELRDIVETLKGQALHAYSLRFIHPVSNEELYIKSDMPNEMKKIIELSFN